MPCEDNVLRNITIDRPSIRVGREELMPRDIEQAMTAVITKEVELARRLAPLKLDVVLCPDYTLNASFKSVDK